MNVSAARSSTSNRLPSRTARFGRCELNALSHRGSRSVTDSRLRERIKYDILTPSGREELGTHLPLGSRPEKLDTVS